MKGDKAIGQGPSAKGMSYVSMTPAARSYEHARNRTPATNASTYFATMHNNQCNAVFTSKRCTRLRHDARIGTVAAQQQDMFQLCEALPESMPNANMYAQRTRGTTPKALIDAQHHHARCARTNETSKEKMKHLPHSSIKRSAKATCTTHSSSDASSIRQRLARGIYNKHTLQSAHATDSTTPRRTRPKSIHKGILHRLKNLLRATHTSRKPVPCTVPSKPTTLRRQTHGVLKPS